ncbi:hypothetical protein MKEN_00842200 [Mycena kentingensis (nom. inval.)]|nr:hypothetical protein MKEN_00842200 [Mycena kentingensis (nom. inval.)]
MASPSPAVSGESAFQMKMAPGLICDARHTPFGIPLIDAILEKRSQLTRKTQRTLLSRVSKWRHDKKSGKTSRPCVLDKVTKGGKIEWVYLMATFGGQHPDDLAPEIRDFLVEMDTQNALRDPKYQLVSSQPQMRGSGGKPSWVLCRRCQPVFEDGQNGMLDVWQKESIEGGIWVLPPELKVIRLHEKQAHESWDAANHGRMETHARQVLHNCHQTSASRRGTPAPSLKPVSTRTRLGPSPLVPASTKRSNLDIFL